MTSRRALQSSASDRETWCWQYGFLLCDPSIRFLWPTEKKLSKVWDCCESFADYRWTFCQCYVQEFDGTFGCATCLFDPPLSALAFVSDKAEPTPLRWRLWDTHENRLRILQRTILRLLTDYSDSFESDGDTERNFTSTEIPVSAHFGAIFDGRFRWRVGSIQMSLIEYQTRKAHIHRRSMVDHLTQTSLSDAGVALVISQYRHARCTQFLTARVQITLKDSFERLLKLFDWRGWEFPEFTARCQKWIVLYIVHLHPSDRHNDVINCQLFQTSYFFFRKQTGTCGRHFISLI